MLEDQSTVNDRNSCLPDLLRIDPPTSQNKELLDIGCAASKARLNPSYALRFSPAWKQPSVPTATQEDALALVIGSSGDNFK